KSSCYEKKPTDFKDEKKHRKIATVDVGGTAWGSAVHRIFDYLIKEDPDEQLLSLHIEKAPELPCAPVKAESAIILLILAKEDSLHFFIPFTMLFIVATILVPVSPSATGKTLISFRYCSI
ncbi:unnamed protein product, partial [marine sediment metagenome]